MEEKTITAYKRFDKDLKCRGFQYEIGKEYEEKRIEIGRKGFHACENPLDVFSYSDLIGSRFCEVEQYGTIQRNDRDSLICSSRIRIKSELTINEMINLCIKFLKKEPKDKLRTRMVLSKHGECFKSSGYRDKIGSCANSVKIGTSGLGASIWLSGTGNQIGVCGNDAEIMSSGYGTTIGSAGYQDYIVSTGGNTRMGMSGYGPIVGSYGYMDRIASSGGDTEIYSYGNNTMITLSGDFGHVDSKGENSVVVCAGNGSRAKAKTGSWITLAEWGYKEGKYIPICVKTEYVDGERIKEDTWYKLENGEFVECY